MTQRIVAQLLTQANILRINCDQWIKLSSGIYSPIYFDMRRLSSHPDLRRGVIDQLENFIRESFSREVLPAFCFPELFGIFGIPNGATGYASVLAYKLYANLVHFGSVKNHGIPQEIYGIEQGMPVLIIDDTARSGRSIVEKGILPLRARGVLIHSAFAIVSYELGMRERLEELGVNSFVLCTAGEVLEEEIRVSPRSGRMYTEEQISLIRRWLKNPDEESDIYCKNRGIIT